MTGWVVRDDRGLDEETMAGAAASQASLGELIERLRALRYPEVPVPADEGGVAPWPA